jgi:hypothetical protein
MTGVFKKQLPNGGKNNMSGDNSTGNNMIWAITLLLIVAIIAGAVYYSGLLGGAKKEKIDINVSAPSSGAAR